MCIFCADQIRTEQQRSAASEEKALKIDALLAELKKEATALRQAAEEHARYNLPSPPLKYIKNGYKRNQYHTRLLVYWLDCRFSFPVDLPKAKATREAMLYRGVLEMRTTAEAAQRYLEQERGMQSALSTALQ